MKPIPIVIVSYNTLPYTRRCIESMDAYSHYPFSYPCRIIVVDNGSTDGTRDYLEGLGDTIDIIALDENLGWVKGVNIGLEEGLKPDPEYIIFCNSDIVANDPRWLLRYADLLKLEDVGAVGPVSNFVMGLQKYEFNRQLPPIHETKFLIGFFMAVRVDVFRKIGLLDERFTPGGNDDLDLSIRIRQAGYKLLVNRRAFIFHYGSKTLLDVFGGWEGIEREDKRTRKLLTEKHGQDTVDELFEIPAGLTQYFTEVGPLGKEDRSGQDISD